MVDTLLIAEVRVATGLVVGVKGTIRDLGERGDGRRAPRGSARSRPPWRACPAGRADVALTNRGVARERVGGAGGGAKQVRIIRVIAVVCLV